MSATVDTPLSKLAETLPEPCEQQVPETLIVSREPLLSLRLGDLWRYRELLLFLVWRDIKVRYKQTALGAAWALLQPFLAMLVFTLIFGRMAHMPSDNIPYPLFVYTALLPWQLFAFAVTESGTSLVTNQQLIRKVYFPRLIIPISAVLVGLVDFALSLTVLAGMMIYYHVRLAPTALLFLPFLALAVVTALSVGIWLSALNIKYRDVRYIIPFLTQFWMFATPVAYSASLVPAQWRALYGLNPMTGVVDGFRWSILGSVSSGNSVMMPVSMTVVLFLLVTGLIYFRRMERCFADLV